MLLAIYKDGLILKTGKPSQLFPQTSFPPTGPEPEFLEMNNAYIIESWKEHDFKVQKLESVKPYFQDGKVYSVVIVNKTEQDYANELEQAALDVRIQRDKLLAESDWTALKDVNVSDEWVVYRQALRDITSQEGFPFNVVYPDKPIK